MSAGTPITTADLNAQAGEIARRTFAAMLSIQQYYTWLASLPADTLVNTYGMAGADQTTMLAAFVDLNDLATVFNGGTGAYLTGTHDYRTYPRKLLGTGRY